MTAILKHTKLLVALGSLLALGVVSGQAAANSPSWLTYAKEYVEKDKQLIDEPNAPHNTTLQYLDDRNKVAVRLIQLSPIPVAELAKLLSSSDATERRAVMAAAMITQVNDMAFVQTALKSYLEEDDYLVKFYSHGVVARLAALQLKAIETQYLHALEHERVEDAHLEGIPNLARLDQNKVLPLLMRYLRFGSPGLRRAAVIQVARMDMDFVAKVKKDLDRHKAKDALKLLREVEESPQ